MRFRNFTSRHLAFLAWVFAIAAGFRVIVEYELRAGPDASPPAHWPANAGLVRNPTQPHLVMFAHPQCPCTRASVGELAVIMTRCAGQLKATVCFYDPDAEPAEWTQSSLWQSVAAIPGVEVLADRDGLIATAFGSATSGQALLFDRDGHRLFSGGITGARGHAGENVGRNYVIALARGEVCAATTTPVFGCSLLGAPTVPAEDTP